MEQGDSKFELETNRIEALSDGVVAIAMTLMIFDIKVPVLHGDAVARELQSSVLGLWPKFICYVISFITLGVYWVAHHLHFMTIRRADRNLLWINVLFLLAICLVPFSTALIGEYHQQSFAVAVFGVNMIFVGLILQLHWSYATRGHRLIDPGVSLDLIKSVTHVIMMGPVVYAIAVAMAYVNTNISIALYLLVTLLYIVPGGIHLHLKPKQKSAA